jgi:hypothetical protein
MTIDLPQAPARVETDPLCLEELVDLEAQLAQHAQHARGYWKAVRLVRWAISKRENPPQPSAVQLELPFKS